MKKELIQYRQKKARDTLEDAALLFHAERLFSTLNRIYYALFYEVVALLLTADLSSAKHTVSAPCSTSISSGQEKFPWN